MNAAISKIPVKFNLPKSLADQLNDQIPSGQKSKFVIEALEEALRRQKIEAAVNALENAPSFPLKDGLGTVDTVRLIRQEMETHAVEKSRL